MTDLAIQVVERSVSVPGVQPKLSMTLVKGTLAKGESRLTVVGALGGNYIFKPPAADFPELPANESLTMRIAEFFGLPVVPSSLIRLASGELSYLTLRIDRMENGEKIHMLDMFQITEAFDKYKSSMEKVGKAIGEYSINPLLDKLNLFEMTVFCFLTGNNDMHLKNFSMIQSGSGWKLSPYYDLLNVAIANPLDREELALTMVGKKGNFNLDHFYQFGKDLGLNPKQIAGVFRRIRKNKDQAVSWINRSFLSPEMKSAYHALLESRYERIFRERNFG